MKTYLIGIETNYFINEKLKELINDNSNVISFNLDENKLDEVLEEASYFSMFNEEKCLIVKNAYFFGSNKKSDSNKSKTDSDKLLTYLDDPNPNVKLIFIYNGVIDTKKKIYHLLKEHNNVFIYKKLTKTEMKNTLLEIVNQKGYKIEDKSLWYIINNSLGNMDIAINEITKIMLYYNKKCLIEYNDVVNLTAKTMEENNFKLVDSILANDLECSMKLMEEAKLFKVDENIILSLLYREYKLMLYTILYKESGLKESEILTNLNLAPWQYEKVNNNLRNYNKKEIEEEIKYLSELDYKLKSGNINKDTIVINYILHLY